MLCENPYIKKNWFKTKDLLETNWMARIAATPFPCGKCLPCKKNRARIWSTRLVLENYTCEESGFVTLTFNDEHLPETGLPSMVELQKYIKRLRKELRNGERPIKIRYFGVGERGQNNGRAHYHIAVFGAGHSHTERFQKCWRHPVTKKEKGFVDVGDITEASARYITKYIVDDEKDNCFSIMSKGLGLDGIKEITKWWKGKEWFNQEKVQRTIKIGGKERPLGRYLTDKMCELLDTNPWMYIQELIDYQDELFNKHNVCSYGYRRRLIDEHEQARKNQKARHKIWNQKRSL